MRGNFSDKITLICLLIRDFTGNFCALTKISTHFLCIVRYRWQLPDVIKQLNQIFNYAEFRNRNPNCDLNFSVAYPVAVQENQSLVLNLSIFTDGVHKKKNSTFKKAIWPIWVQITDLSPF